jgi:sterol 14-demethylase
MLFLLAIPAVVLLVFIISTFFNKKRPSNAPPTATVGAPIIGNYIEFGKNPVHFMQEATKKFGRIFTVNMVGKHLTFLIGPECSAPFYQLGDDKMSQNEVYGFMTPVFGNGVVYSAEPKKRTQQMQCAANGLRAARLKVYVSKIEDEMRLYLKENLKAQTGEVNLLDILSELTILTASRCLHGDDVRENMFAEVSRIYHDLDKGITPISFFFPYAPIPAHNKRDKARLEMVNIFSKIIRARRQEDEAKSAARTDLLQLFIDFMYKEDGTPLTDDQITGLLIALLFAGQHTSSITSTWTTFLLMFNPQCLTKVAEEQQRVLGERANRDFGGDISKVPLDFDLIGDMEYLQNCIKETLRMYPPLIMLMRMAMEDIETTLNGEKYIIPKGDICITSPALSGRLDDVFERSNNFEPDRFGPERNEQKTPFAYLGFGAGRHACIGQQFGLLQVKTIMSILVRNYKFESVDQVIPEPDYTAMVVGPKNHLRVRYTKLPNCTM